MSQKLKLKLELAQCAVCLRHFSPARIETHQEICKKSSEKTRKSFDISRQRTRGIRTEKQINAHFSADTSSTNQFMVQRRVIKLYKDFFRATKDIEDERSRKEVQEWIRNDFKKNKDEKNEYTIQLFIHQGERFLRELKSNISLSR